MRYQYVAEGTAADGQTWVVDGAVLDVAPGQIREVLERALAGSFEALTGGRAILGKPEKDCLGPYTVTRLVVEKFGK